MNTSMTCNCIGPPGNCPCIRAARGDTGPHQLVASNIIPTQADLETAEARGYARGVEAAVLVLREAELEESWLCKEAKRVMASDAHVYDYAMLVLSDAIDRVRALIQKK